ncbi:MAG: DinB family protein [Caldilineaceae bacterium]|nr:DinB family protein [Caldilineaceae bacterium]
MSTIQQYINSVKRIDTIIKRKSEGLTHADSMRQLPFPGNCMNWNIGHILVYRMQYLGVIDGISQPDPAEFAIYGGGSQPLTDSSKAIPLEVLLARIDDASAQVIAALASMPAEKLAEIYDAEQGTTLADRLTFYLLFHESYHAGQLEILHELALAHKL